MDTDAHMHTHWGGDAGAGTGMDTDARMHTHWGGDAAEGTNVDGHAHTHTHTDHTLPYTFLPFGCSQVVHFTINQQ